MGRARKNEMRPSVKCGHESVPKAKNSKQYAQSGPKATGPNYPKIKAFVDGKVQ